MENQILKSKTPKVYKHKFLNTASFGGFHHSDYQIFLDLISKIGGVDEKGKYLQPAQMKREHVLTAKEHAKKFNLNVDNSYRYLKQSCDKLMEKMARFKKEVFYLTDRHNKSYCTSAYAINFNIC